MRQVSFQKLPLYQGLYIEYCALAAVHREVKGMGHSLPCLPHRDENTELVPYEPSLAAGPIVSPEELGSEGDD